MSLKRRSVVKDSFDRFAAAIFFLGEIVPYGITGPSPPPLPVRSSGTKRNIYKMLIRLIIGVESIGKHLYIGY